MAMLLRRAGAARLPLQLARALTLAQPLGPQLWGMRSLASAAGGDQSFSRFGGEPAAPLTDHAGAAPAAPGAADPVATGASAGDGSAVSGKKPYTWFKLKSRFKRAGHLLNQLNLEGMQAREGAAKIPYFQVGDAIEVTYKQSTVSEELSTARGMVIGRRNAGLSSNFRVALVAVNQSAQLTFPLYSPLIQEIKVIQKAFLHRGKKRVRRAKLYYVEDRPQSLITVRDGFAREMERHQQRLQEKAAGSTDEI